eukprot:m51a1_g6815 hypothetical protein (1216) ;mRNA; f:278252-282683
MPTGSPRGAAPRRTLRAAALCCAAALHQRLGSDSPLALIDVPLLQSIFLSYVAPPPVLVGCWYMHRGVPVESEMYGSSSFSASILRAGSPAAVLAAPASDGIPFFARLEAFTGCVAAASVSYLRSTDSDGYDPVHVTLHTWDPSSGAALWSLSWYCQRMEGEWKLLAYDVLPERGAECLAFCTDSGICIAPISGEQVGRVRVVDGTARLSPYILQWQDRARLLALSWSAEEHTVRVVCARTGAVLRTAKIPAVSEENSLLCGWIRTQSPLLQPGYYFVCSDQCEAMLLTRISDARSYSFSGACGMLPLGAGRYLLNHRRRGLPYIVTVTSRGCSIPRALCAEASRAMQQSPAVGVCGDTVYVVRPGKRASRVVCSRLETGREVHSFVLPANETMEEVLEAIADNVSTLVLAMSSAESARPGTQLYLPNLVPATHMIKEAIDGMCEAARITGQDPNVPADTRAVVEKTAAELAADAAGLEAGATTAANEPARAVEATKSAIRCARSILQKVVVLVMLEDQLNIQIFFTVAKRAADVVRRISAADTVQGLSAVVSEIPQIVGEFLRRTKRRADNTKMPDEKAKLNSSLEAFSNDSSQHLSAARDHVASPSDAARKATAEIGQRCLASIDQILAVVREIFDRNAKFIGAAFAFRAPTSIVEDEVIAGTRELNNRLDAVALKASRGDPDTVAATRSAVEQANQVLASAKAAADLTADPCKKAFINRGIDDVQRLVPQVVGQVKTVLQDPSNKQAMADLDDLIRATKTASDNLAAAVSGSPESALAHGAGDLVKGMQELKRDCDARDIEAATRDLRRLEQNFDRHIDLANMYAEHEQDPVKKQQLLEAVDSLKKAKQRFMAAARKFLTNPTPEALKQLDEMMALTQQALFTISPPHVAAAALAQDVARELEALLEAVKAQDQPEAVQRAKNVAASMRAQVSIAEQYAQHLSPARRAAILAAVARGKDAAAKMVEAMKDALQNPGSASHLARLEALTEATRKARQPSSSKREGEGSHSRAAAEIAELMQPTAEEAAAEKQRGIALRKALAEEVNPTSAAKLKVDGPKDAQIFAAAVKVESSVPYGADADTPYGKLLNSSHNIAQLMAQLSNFAAVGNKKGMIDTARALAGAVHEVITQSKTMADKCTDPRLKSDCLNYSQACQNFIVNLKIVCAVKAASDDNDPTVQEQLVSAAQGLANSVVNTVNACSAAAVHKSVRNAK